MPKWSFDTTRSWKKRHYRKSIFIIRTFFYFILISLGTPLWAPLITSRPDEDVHDVGSRARVLGFAFSSDRRRRWRAAGDRVSEDVANDDFSLL